MKIIQIGNYPEDASIIKGGVQASVYGLSQALSKKHEVVVLSIPQKELKEDYRKKDGNVRVYFFCNKYKFNIFNIFCINKLLNLIKKENADVIHIHETSFISLLLTLCLKLKRKKTVLTVHGIAFIEFRQDFNRKKSVQAGMKFIFFSIVEFLCVNLNKKIIVDTKYVKKSLKKITLRKPVVIPQGINNIFYGLEDRYKNNELISIGVISPRKGYEYSIEAIKRVREKFPDIHYTIIGIKKEDLADYCESLFQKIRACNLENNISIKLNLPQSRILPLLEEAGIFLLHSREESQGIVFCEAMAAGKPIVATNIGGIPDVVKDGENGFLSKYGDVEAFANNITDILSDNSLRMKMSEQSRKLSETYSWEIISKKIVYLYEL